MIEFTETCTRRNRINRRTAMTVSAAALTTCLTKSASAADESSPRRFTLDLRASSIGVNAAPPRVIELADENGFESVNADASYLAELTADQRSALVAKLTEAGLVWGSAGLPVEFRKDEKRFRDDLGRLSERAAALREAGGSRMGTYLMPSHDELTYVQNFRLHAERLRRCALVLRDHGIRFGLEYVGPKTSWTAKDHPFIHSMAELKDLIAEINVDNVGFILDSWHWYTAGETAADLLSLTNDDVVGCDLNDAPLGRTVAEQLDLQRELPLATGVIDLKTFMECLVKIGYDGPVRAEPFNATLNELDNEAAVAATAAAMKSAIALI